MGMPTFAAVARVAAIFLAFAFLHSLFVAERVKGFFRRLLGDAFMLGFYRLAFTAWSALATAGAFYLITLVPDAPVYRLSGWLKWAMHTIQAGGVLVGIMAFRVIDPWEFLGLRQAWRRLRGRGATGDVEGLTGGLVTGGVYGVARNPLYLAGVLVFTFNPYMTRTWLTVAALADLYFIFGALIEERRLLRRFGRDYAEYRRRVPLLVPRPGALLRVLRRK